MHIFPISLPIAKLDVYAQVSGTMELPACIHSGFKETNSAALQSFTMLVASDESPR